MAKDKITVRVNLRQNTNQKSDQYGHYYPYLDKNHTLSLRGLARHIADHGSIYTRDVVQGVLTQLSECIPELCAQGVPVKLDGLGTFSPYIESTKDGATTLADAQGASPADFVAGVHVRFIPDGTDLDNITSRVFKEKCSMYWGDVVEIVGYKNPQKKYGPQYKKTGITNPAPDEEPEP